MPSFSKEAQQNAEAFIREIAKRHGEDLMRNTRSLAETSWSLKGDWRTLVKLDEDYEGVFYIRYGRTGKLRLKIRLSDATKQYPQLKAGGFSDKAWAAISEAIEDRKHEIVRERQRVSNRDQAAAAIQRVVGATYKDGFRYSPQQRHPSVRVEGTVSIENLPIFYKHLQAYLSEVE